MCRKRSHAGRYPRVGWDIKLSDTAVRSIPVVTGEVKTADVNYYLSHINLPT